MLESCISLDTGRVSRGGGGGGGGEGGGGEHTLVDSMVNTQDTVLNIVSSSNTLLQIMIQISFQKRKNVENSGGATNFYIRKRDNC